MYLERVPSHSMLVQTENNELSFQFSQCCISSDKFQLSLGEKVFRLNAYIHVSYH